VYAMWRSFSSFGTGNYFAQPGGDGPVSSGPTKQYQLRF
jgi:hypothetical protein